MIATENVEQSLARLAQVVTVEREQRGLSPEELARRAGMSAARLLRLEAGSQAVRFSDLVAVSRALETSPADLMRRVERAYGAAG